MDNFGEDVVVTGLAVGGGLAIGGTAFLYRKWRDKKNSPTDGTEELKYIEQSQQQKSQGWSFQQRYQFLKEAGFRKNNIDDILGKAERFEQTEVSDEHFEQEYNNVLDTTDNAERDEFLLRSYAWFRNGMLADLPLHLVQEARSKRVGQYVKLYRNLCGEAIEFCMSQQPFDEDEIMVGADEEWFLLTNKKIYLFRKKKDYSLVRIVPLREIAEYDVRGWWTFRMDVQFTNGEIFTLKSLDKVPDEKVVSSIRPTS